MQLDDVKLKHDTSSTSAQSVEKEVRTTYLIKLERKQSNGTYCDSSMKSFNQICQC